MSHIWVRAPESLTLWTAPGFCKAIQGLSSFGEYVFDFKNTKTVEPFGMLLVSSELKNFIENHPDSKITFTHVDHMTYAGHMGFFQSFGHAFGKFPGQASGSKNYIPITEFETSVLNIEAARSGLEVGDVIEAQSKRLAATLICSDSGEVFETLSYSIREMIRNVVEHAQVERFAVCSQYWPTKGRAEVAIVDRGIGLKKSLSVNPHIDASTHKSAINFALMPAVSGKSFKGSRRPSNKGHWVNSGFGLYMTSRICRRGGNFFISSGDTGMLLTSGKDSKRYLTSCSPGTAVRLSIRTNEVADLRDSLERFRNDGYEFQKRYAEIVNIDPSSASLMLSQDFDISLFDRFFKALKS